MQWTIINAWTSSLKRGLGVGWGLSWSTAHWRKYHRISILFVTYWTIFHIIKDRAYVFDWLDSSATDIGSYGNQSHSLLSSSSSTFPRNFSCNVVINSSELVKSISASWLWGALYVNQSIAKLIVTLKRYIIDMVNITRVNTSLLKYRLTSLKSALNIGERKVWR